MRIPRIYLRSAGTSRREITKFERQANIRLPADYKQFLLETNGGIPHECVFEVPALSPKGRRSVSCFWGIGPDWGGRDLLAALRTQTTLPDGLLPIADVWINYLYLDLRAGRPGVGYWYNQSFPTNYEWREHEFHHVADTFEEFLDSLKPEPPRRKHLRMRNGQFVFPLVKPLNAPTTKAAISKLERHLGRKLPNIYKDFLLRSNGGRSRRRRFPVERYPWPVDEAIEWFYAVDSAHTWDDIRHHFDWFRGGIPEGLVPIASAGACQYVCFDLREGGHCIKLWDNSHFWGTGEWRDRDLFAVADSFEEFLADLRPNPL